MNFTDQFLQLCCKIDRSAATMAHVRCLAVVSRHKGIKMTDLAEKLGAQPASMTSMIDTLETMGLVNRVHQLHDRRAIKIHITHEGEQFLKKLMP